MKNLAMGVGLVLALSSAVSAEVTQFRIGNALTWLADVIGFSVLDTTSAIYDLGLLALLLGLAYWVLHWLKIM